MAERVKVVPRGPIELPVLDATRCTGCGLCVHVCPTRCLALGLHLPWLPRPRDCVACGLCVAVCPASALTLEENG